MMDPNETNSPNETYGNIYPPPDRPRSVVLRSPDRKPMVTYTILGLTIGVFILQLISQSALGLDYPLFLGAKFNEAILSGEVWRLITPVLLHGSFIHIAFNMYALFILGPALENQYGAWRFLALYLLGGFAGNVVSFIFSPNPSLGSSTAIFGFLGAQAVLILQNRQFFGNRYRSVLTSTIGIAAVNLIIGLSPGIDNWGHIGGLIGGTLFAWFAGPVWDVKGFYPDLHLSDVRSKSRITLTAVSVGLLFALLAFLSSLNRFPGT